MTRIAVIGGGRIGEALIAGLLAAGRAAVDLVVAEPVQARAQQLADRFGIRVVAEVSAAAHDAELVIIAVKPADVDTVACDLAKIEFDSGSEQIVACMAAGIPIMRLEDRLPTGAPVIRVMSNTPMLVGAGMSVLAAGNWAQPRHLELVSEVLGAVGKVAVVTEDKMDAVTAVSGSGPAYFFLVVEAMIDAAVGLGLTREVATTLVSQTFVGSAAMVTQTADSPVELRAAVTSPGGTTAAALRELERHGMRSAFLEALHAAADRSAQQGRG